MARRKSDAPPRNSFEETMHRKDLDAKILAKRWGKTVRRINQICVNPNQLHIDAIQGIPKRRKRSSLYEFRLPLAGRNEFDEIMVEKSISADYLANRWDFKVRRINQIRNNPEVLHIDAIKGIPRYRKNKSTRL